MNHLWWLPVGIGFIGAPMGLAHYVEKRLEERNIGNKITGIVCVMLWGAFTLGMYIANNVID